MPFLSGTGRRALANDRWLSASQREDEEARYSVLAAVSKEELALAGNTIWERMPSNAHSNH